jgi:hypothetical protein
VRIPLACYEHVIWQTRVNFPGLPVHIFSDRCGHVLGTILVSNGVSPRSEQSGDADLLSLAQARLLTGSNHTFSRSATFQGEMTSAWLDTEQFPKQPTAEVTPILNVADDVEEITREAVTAA